MPKFFIWVSFWRTGNNVVKNDSRLHGFAIVDRKWQ